MFENPLPPRQLGQQQYGMEFVPDSMPSVAVPRNDTAHQRNLSVHSMDSSYFSSPVFFASAGFHGLPTPTPAIGMAYGIGPGSICDDSSRSTSAYSNIPFSSLPISTDVLGHLNDHHPGTSQVKASLSKINVFNGNRAVFSKHDLASHESHIMPPPPLPRHALDAEVGGTTERRAFTSPGILTFPQLPQPAQSPGDRRKESRSNESDISMHAGCTSFPDCTISDPQGHLIHTPSAVVQGRKEGDGNNKSGKCQIVVGVAIRLD